MGRQADDSESFDISQHVININSVDANFLIRLVNNREGDTIIKCFCITFQETRVIETAFLFFA